VLDKLLHLQEFMYHCLDLAKVRLFAAKAVAWLVTLVSGTDAATATRGMAALATLAENTATHAAIIKALPEITAATADVAETSVNTMDHAFVSLLVFLAVPENTPIVQECVPLAAQMLRHGVCNPSTVSLLCEFLYTLLSQGVVIEPPVLSECILAATKLVSPEDRINVPAVFFFLIKGAFSGDDVLVEEAITPDVAPWVHCAWQFRHEWGGPGPVIYLTNFIDELV
jgi:hypothetical protein